MSAFYVGQRVRIVRTDEAGDARWIGREGIITEGFGLFECVDRFLRAGWNVDIGQQYSFVATENEIEPILPEGMEPISEVLELWEPSPEYARVT